MVNFRKVTDSDVRLRTELFAELIGVRKVLSGIGVRIALARERLRKCIDFNTIYRVSYKVNLPETILDLS